MKPREPPQISADTVDVPADHIVEKAGVRLTSPARTALDCARWLPRYEAVAALDQFLRRGVKPEELAKMARTLPGYRGNKRYARSSASAIAAPHHPAKAGYGWPSCEPASRVRTRRFR